MNMIQIEIYTAKPNLAPDFINWMNSVHNKDESKLNYTKFLEPFTEGYFESSCQNYSIPLNVKLHIQSGGWLEKLIDLNNSKLNALKSTPLGKPDLNQRLNVAKELYEFLEPIRAHRDYSNLILNRELWDYLSLSLFRNFIVARWGLEERTSTTSFKKRILLSSKAIRSSGEIKYTQRALHSLYRLYWAYYLVHDLPVEHQIKLFGIEQGMQDYLQREIMFSSKSLLNGAIKFAVDHDVCNDTKSIRSFLIANQAYNNSHFSRHLDCNQYCNRLSEGFSNEFLNQLKGRSHESSQL